MDGRLEIAVSVSSTEKGFHYHVSGPNSLVVTDITPCTLKLGPGVEHRPVVKEPTQKSDDPIKAGSKELQEYGISHGTIIAPVALSYNIPVGVARHMLQGTRYNLPWSEMYKYLRVSLKGARAFMKRYGNILVDFMDAAGDAVDEYLRPEPQRKKAMVQPKKPSTNCKVLNDDKFAACRFLERSFGREGMRLFIKALTVTSDDVECYIELRKRYGGR